MSYNHLVSNCKRLFKKIDIKNMSTKKDNIKSNDIDRLNELINKQYSKEIEDKLSDENLNEQFIKCNSSQKIKTQIKNILKNDYNDDVLLQKRVEQLLALSIPAGTKGVIRGNMFNNIVKEELLLIKKDYDQLDISFEKKIKDCNERPDFIIKCNNKYIIGMNQVDLWNGGQQLNRASNYLDDLKNTETKKFLCVIAYKYIFKNSHRQEKSKSFILIKNGLENNRLCYVNNLKNIIVDFFSTLK